MFQQDQIEGNQKEHSNMPEKPKLGGMGSSGAQGKYEGFGNAADIKGKRV